MTIMAVTALWRWLCRWCGNTGGDSDEAGVWCGGEDGGGGDESAESVSVMCKDLFLFVSGLYLNVTSYFNYVFVVFLYPQ